MVLTGRKIVQMTDLGGCEIDSDPPAPAAELEGLVPELVVPAVAPKTPTSKLVKDRSAAPDATNFDGLVELLGERLDSSRRQQLHAQILALQAELAAERNLRTTQSPPASPVDDVRRCRSADSTGARGG